jgi:hypothetical protein
MNISSVTRNSVGDYTLNFTTAMPNSNYSAVMGSANTAGVYIMKGAVGGVYSTTAFNLIVLNTSTASIDVDILNVAIFR